MAGPTIEGLMGGFLIEIFIALALYGVAMAQMFVYWLNSGEDSKLLKSIVAVVCTLETLHSVFAVHMVYSYTISSFGNLEAIGHIVWSAGCCVLSEMMIILFVQGFYIRRIWILSKQNIALTSITGFFLFLRVGFGIATTGLTYHIDTWAEFRAEKGPLVTLVTGLALSAAVDLLIALILIYFLHKGRTGFKETDHVLQSLMAYAVNTGALTMCVSLATVLTFVFLPSSLSFAGFVNVSSKLYANSLLGTLNARQVFRRRGNTSHKSTSELSNRVQARSGSYPLQRHIEIYQETSKVVDSDPGSTFPAEALSDEEQQPQKFATLE